MTHHKTGEEVSGGMAGRLASQGAEMNLRRVPHTALGGYLKVVRWPVDRVARAAAREAARLRGAARRRKAARKA
jgi:hypothetical protein